MKLTRSQRLWSLSLLALSLSLAVVPDAAAQAQTKPLSETLSGDAREAYNVGVILYGGRDFANAYERFREAHAMSGDPRLLWNMAVCKKSLTPPQYARTQALIQRYLSEAGAAGVLSEDDKTKAKEALDIIDTLVGSLNIRANEPGAKIFIDGEEVGETPPEQPLKVDVGKRSVLLKKEGFVDFSGQIEVDSRSIATLEAKLVKITHEGKISVKTSVPSSIIEIDNKKVGNGQWFGAVSTGAHLLRVTAEGHEPYTADFALTEGGVRTFDVTLKAVKKPVPLWVWIGGSVVLAGALATTSYFVFRPERKSECNADPSLCLGSNSGMSFNLP